MVALPATDDAVDLLFHALSDATRRDILRRASGADLSMSAIAVNYAMSFAAVQKHISVLERAGLVSKRRLGREQLVHTDRERVRAAREALERLEGAWLGRVDRMSEVLREAGDL